MHLHVNINDIFNEKLLSKMKQFYEKGGTVHISANLSNIWLNSKLDSQIWVYIQSVGICCFDTYFHTDI